MIADSELQNLLIYHLVSGHAWFSCGLVVLAVIALDALAILDGRNAFGGGARVLLAGALVVAALTGTPLSPWLAVPLVVGLLGYLAFGFAAGSKGRRRALGAGAAALVLAALALELPYHFPAPLRPSGRHRLYVIGDSLAAGVGNDAVTWPRLLAERASLDVRDLSAMGATTRAALRKQAPALEKDADPGSVVLLEIGGHDMLGASSAEEFGRGLDRLLAVAAGDALRPRPVVMLELPVLPGKWAFGAMQRRLAARHGALLVPKRLLAGVVLTEENVIDGLHLSRAGHRRMAEQLAVWLGG